MAAHEIRQFGTVVSRLIKREHLTREEAFDAFTIILLNETTPIQQGAFLAALTAKGETTAEIAGCRDAIYQHDTIKVSPYVNGPIVENSGTGMDSFKTFNISTAASIIAAAYDGIYLARHGARAITGKCGTVDIAEQIGINVECDASLVVSSVERCGIGLFNGMSAKVHPSALGRILSQIAFGSTLNIAASLASPVCADIGVRGVSSRQMIRPTIDTMKEIGYKRAVVFHGYIDGTDKGMDEVSVCGDTYVEEYSQSGRFDTYTLRPEMFGLPLCKPDDLAPGDNAEKEVSGFVNLFKGKGSMARQYAAIVNAGMILYAASKTDSLHQGITIAESLLSSGKSMDKLIAWVQCQNTDVHTGIAKLNRILEA
ncbi:MAG: anthranilate phosphoribosyltransferase [Fibrobacterota bacterium]|nr:anthranilate phosphoribosyltransferase [Chitinispirillaceae bacterium]